MPGKQSKEPTMFERMREMELSKEQPLAARMRPRTLDEYVGQEHILAPGRLLRRAVQADQLSSLIFYGPPGTGKTTLASVIANTTRSTFVTLNAVMAGIADVKEVTTSARKRLLEYGMRTILFVDEVHRWNKAQQDALLPWVENGTVILIGATTENPYFTVNRALVSRSRIFQLKPLEERDVRKILHQAISDPERGYGKRKILLEPDAEAHLANVANGDARAALNALELAVETTRPDETGLIRIPMSVAEESIQRRAVLYDREGDCHFDTISAFIKSMRGSDPDAVFYWLAKMVYAGEDPRFIFRRMVIFASEDIGMADPHAVPFVIACAEAFDRVGLPEGHFPLAHAALYCATAPKSNSVLGFFDALKAVRQEREGEVPNHLRDASRDKEGFGHGEGYQYPHAYRDHWVAQQYLPTTLQGKLFYEPGVIGYEKELAAVVRQRRELQMAALRENENPLAPPEILTFGKTDGMGDRWLARAVEHLSGTLASIREKLFALHPLQRHERVLDLTADTGELTWEALRLVPEGGVWSLTASRTAAAALQDLSENLTDLRRPVVLSGAAEQLPDCMQSARAGDVRFDFAVGRNLLGRYPDAEKRVDVLKAVAAWMEPGGVLALAEVLPRRAQRLTAYLQPEEFSGHPELLEKLRKAEEAVYADESEKQVLWSEPELTGAFAAAGLPAPQCEMHTFSQMRRILAPQLAHWFAREEKSFAGRMLRQGISPAELELFASALQKKCQDTDLPWHASYLFLKCRME